MTDSGLRSSKLFAVNNDIPFSNDAGTGVDSLSMSSAFLLNYPSCELVTS